MPGSEGRSGRKVLRIPTIGIQRTKRTTHPFVAIILSEAVHRYCPRGTLSSVLVLGAVVAGVVVDRVVVVMSVLRLDHSVLPRINASRAASEAMMGAGLNVRAVAWNR